MAISKGNSWHVKETNSSNFLSNVDSPLKRTFFNQPRLFSNKTFLKYDGHRILYPLSTQTVYCKGFVKPLLLQMALISIWFYRHYGIL